MGREAAVSRLESARLLAETTMVQISLNPKLSHDEIHDLRNLVAKIDGDIALALRALEREE